MLFKKTLIIGLGLIGGSFAKSLNKNNISEKIFAVDLDLQTINLAKISKSINGGFSSLSHVEKLYTFDLIVIATPILTYGKIFRELVGQISSNCIVIDLGSVKNLKIKALPKNFIPCHPIAGLESNGFKNSCADLFLNRRFIICKKDSPQKINELANKIGSKPEFLDAKKHDEIYALVSHLPQLLSFLTKDFSPKNIENRFFQNAFRLDNSKSEIWADTFKANEKNIEKFYEKFFSNFKKTINQISNINNIIGLINQEHYHTHFNIKSINQKFFEENFAIIFLRALMAISYLQITEIKLFKSYAGSGFKDFISIISILNFDKYLLINLIKKNQQEILQLFNTISILKDARTT